MALKERHTGETGAPRWVVPLYLAGLVSVYLGERAFSALEKGGPVLTWLGVGLAVFATLVRLHPRYAGRAGQRSIERAMFGLSLAGLLALALYGLTTERGRAVVGLHGERALGVVTVLWVALLLLSLVPLIFAEIARGPMRKAEHPEGRRVLAAAVSGGIVAAAAVYGALFVYAASQVDASVDYSYFKTSRPGDSTKKIAASLPEDVRVTAFFPQVNEVKSEVLAYLGELRQAAPKLQIESVDRLLEPKKATELRATQDGILVVSKGKVTRSLTLGVDMKEARPKLKTLDRDFQELLLKVGRAKRTAYLTVGHGELNDASPSDRGAQGVRQLLQRQNYDVRDLGLAQGLGRDVPQDADVLLVLGPKRPFTDEELAALRRYAERGGKLFLALDPDLAEGEPEVALEAGALDRGLGALAGVVGLDFDPARLAHETTHVRRRYNDSDRVMLVTASFSSHPAVSTLSRGAPRSAVVVSGSGSLKKKGDAPAELKVDVSLKSTPGTFADQNGNFRKDADEKSENYGLAVAVSRKSTAQPDKKPKKDDARAEDVAGEMRAFVIGDVDALSDVFLVNAPNNPLLIVDPVRWLGGEESYAGEVNVEEDVRIEHTKKGDQLWFYGTIFGVPALVLGSGLWLGRLSKRPRKERPARAEQSASEEEKAA
jgi:hypothetical protein